MTSDKVANLINSKRMEVLLTVLPFSFILIYHVLLSMYWNGEWMGGWISANDVFSIFVLIVVLFATIMKWYKSNWYFVWLGFLIYFSSIHLIALIIPVSWNWIALDWIWNSVFKYMQLHYFTPELIPPYGYFYTAMMNIFLFINLIFFYILYKKFKANLVKIFYLIFTYYFSYCNLIVPLYYFGVQRLHINESMSIQCITTFYIINSLFSIIYLLLLLNSKTTVMKATWTIIFFVSNFFAINIYQIISILDKSFIISTPFNTFAHLIKLYIKYFLIIPNMVYFFIFLFVIRIRRHHHSDVVSRQ
jgi:hypothetical protein